MPGNIITKAGEQEIRSMKDLQDCLSGLKVGDTVDVTVQIVNSGGYVEKQIPVTLTAQSD